MRKRVKQADVSQEGMDAVKFLRSIEYKMDIPVAIVYNQPVTTSAEAFDKFLEFINPNNANKPL